METGYAIFGIVLIVACLLGIVLTNIIPNRKEGKLLQSLIDSANKHSCIISKHEICGDFIVGIDESKKYVFFFKKNKENSVESYVNLAEMKTCRINNLEKQFSSNNDNSSRIEKLELVFTPNSQSIPETSVEFFSIEHASMINGELQLIENWRNIINAKLNNKK